MMNLKSLKTFDWQLRPSRREVVVFVGLLAAIFFLFRQSFSGPQSQVLSAAKQQLRSTEQQLDAMHTLISALQEQYQESQPHADDQVPLTPRLQAILDYRPGDSKGAVTDAVSRLSDRKFLKQVTFSGAKIGDWKEFDNYTRVPIEIKVKGRYSSIVNYLATLENLPLPILVDGVDVASEEGSGFLLANVQLQLYLPK